MPYMNKYDMIDHLAEARALPPNVYKELIVSRDEGLSEYAAKRADEIRREYYGNKIFIRGLIEISNYCRNDCYYCGIGRSNKELRRYHLLKEDILDRCALGYDLGFRTFVLQGGEDQYYTDDILCAIVAEIDNRFPDCAITLSLGERSKESYRKLHQAGTDRYLLRHETIDSAHYSLLHPEEMKLEDRLSCLQALRETGFQVGCGFMVGSPYQTAEMIAKDLAFIQNFAPEMCGIGPFIPHHATRFAKEPAGSAELTFFLISLLRLIKPDLLLPSTTALGSIDPHGREKGIKAGANVIMPNLSPAELRGDYSLYDNKAATGLESAEGLKELKELFADIGYEIVTDRGDPVKR